MICIIAVYLLSVWLMRRYIKIAHSSIGIWSGLNVKLPDLLITILPLLNTFGVIWLYLKESPVKKSKRNYNKFFK
jgi:hypothetical protein